MAKPVSIAVIGGGISGLATAVYLKKFAAERGIEIDLRLIEKSDRLGGVIATEKVDGFTLERGPEGWASYKPAAKKLIQDFDLGSLIAGSKDENRKNFVVREGKLTALPDGMTFFAPVEPIAFWRTAPLSFYGKFRSSLEPFISRSSGDISVQQFFQRRLGKEFTDELVEPLISAILGGNYEKLSTQCVLPELYRVEQRTGSLWKGLRRFAKMTLSTSVLHTMAEGMAELPKILTQLLNEDEYQLGAGDIKVRPNSKKHHLVSGEVEQLFDFIVLCTPASAASQILGPEYSRVNELLDEISYTSSTLVYLAYDRDTFNHPLNGFGFLVPRKEALSFDACTWVNRKFDARVPSDRILIRAAAHNIHRLREFESEEQLIDSVQEQIAQIMHLDAPPVFRKSFEVKEKIPQLFVGHVLRKQRIQSELDKFPGLFLSGSYWSGVGIPDCINSGQETARKIIDSITSDEEGLGIGS